VPASAAFVVIKRFQFNRFLLCLLPIWAHRDENLAMKISTEHLASASDAQVLGLGQLIVRTLNLDVDATTIDPNAPLFGEGLGLDSIDMLEIALAVSQTYGVKLRADDSDNQQIFASLASLSEHIQQHRG
jgi:acyl carrier protein